ncbi:MAG: hypothetical protein K0B87_04615 [Candidatus Syntrophosphaera sp.]|nr:hypothetical protein [Candidatus Syntrophosphaera sp.]
MRRISVIFILALLLASGLRAQNDADALYFKLLEAEEYELDTFYSSELQRLYVQVDFDIPKSQLDPAYHYGVFLERDAQFQSTTISGQYGSHYLVSNLMPEHFVPGLTKPELLNWDSPAIFYGLSLDNYDRMPEIVHFRLWYYLRIPPFKLDETQKLSTGLDANQFWYPRNISTGSKVKLKLTTIPYMTLLVGNAYAAHIDKQYSRIHSITFIETVEHPSSFRLVRD